MSASSDDDNEDDDDAVDYADDSALVGTCARLPLLEALNMSLDAFEQHTLDRRLTMTGQAIFVIT